MQSHELRGRTAGHSRSLSIVRDLRRDLGREGPSREKPGIVRDLRRTLGRRDRIGRVQAL